MIYVNLGKSCDYFKVFFCFIMLIFICCGNSNEDYLKRLYIFRFFFICFWFIFWFFILILILY